VTDAAALLAIVRANPDDKTTALVAADAIQEVMGERWAALRVVTDARRTGRRRNAVARAVSLYCSDGDMRWMVASAVNTFTSTPFADWEPLVIIPGSTGIRRAPKFGVARRTPGSAVVVGYNLVEMPKGARWPSPGQTCIVAGALTLLAFARALGMARINY
jgi:uncharacterized protein (TIGR02996 family)